MKKTLLLALLLGITLKMTAQTTAVLMVPMNSGPLSVQAKELTERIRQELKKSKVDISFIPRKLTLPLSEVDKQFLIKRARDQNLPFLLVQGPDPNDSKTIRHDLFATIDGRLLASVLITGDGGRTALLRSVLLAKEILSQLSELPPVWANQLSYLPESEGLLLLPPLLRPIPWKPPTITLAGTVGFALGPTAKYFSTPLWWGQTEAYWTIGKKGSPFLWGGSLLVGGSEAVGREVKLPMNIFIANLQIKALYRPLSWVELFGAAASGPAFLAFSLPGDSYSGGLVASSSLEAGLNFYFNDRWSLKLSSLTTAVWVLTFPVISSGVSLGGTLKL